MKSDESVVLDTCVLVEVYLLKRAGNRPSRHEDVHELVRRINHAKITVKVLMHSFFELEHAHRWEEMHGGQVFDGEFTLQAEWRYCQELWIGSA